MLAADRSLLEINLKQSAIKLREKELNLYAANFSAMATQAAVLAGFTTTCLIEIEIPKDISIYYKNFFHISAVISICSNITCVSLATISSISGTAKALRGKDGSMDEAVDGMARERAIIFNAFAIGLGGNLCTVLATCFILLLPPIRYIAVFVVVYFTWTITSNAFRIQRKFALTDSTRLDDLTAFNPSMGFTFAGNNPIKIV